eukprot:CCRYP_020753-RA/>CCRYP_020753-RA protein AED:0.45 eAED:0.45 QI:122/1/0.5/1/0/0/2/0/49
MQVFEKRSVGERRGKRTLQFVVRKFQAFNQVVAVPCIRDITSQTIVIQV